MPAYPNERHNEVTAAVWIETAWLDLTRPNPCATDPATWTRLNLEFQRKDAEFWEGLKRQGLFDRKPLDDFWHRYGQPRVVREAHEAKPPEPRGNWPGWYEPRDMIPIALGADEPRWMGGSWWHDRDRRALDRVSCASDVTRISVPEWHRLPIVERMLESRRRWQEAHPDEPPSGFGLTYDLTVPGRAPAQSVNYPSFVDLGAFLVGLTRFFTILGGEPEVGDALMDKFFELSTSYTDFLLSLKPERFDALCGFGGDATCLLSPRLYERYGAAWDARLFEHVRGTHGVPPDLPCNFHSCGPSAHLYGLWGRHPCRDNITTVQTRLLPGKVRGVREAFPRAQLELTIHPQHFDALRASASELRDLLLSSARDAGLRDVHLIVFMSARRPEDLKMAGPNVRACAEAMEALRGTTES